MFCAPATVARPPARSATLAGRVRARGPPSTRGGRSPRLVLAADPLRNPKERGQGSGRRHAGEPAAGVGGPGVFEALADGEGVVVPPHPPAAQHRQHRHGGQVVQPGVAVAVPRPGLEVDQREAGARTPVVPPRRWSGPVSLERALLGQESPSVARCGRARWRGPKGKLRPTRGRSSGRPAGTTQPTGYAPSRWSPGCRPVTHGGAWLFHRSVGGANCRAELLFGDGLGASNYVGVVRKRTTSAGSPASPTSRRPAPAARLTPGREASSPCS